MKNKQLCLIIMLLSGTSLRTYSFEYKGELMLFLLLNFETLDVDELPLLIIKDKQLGAIKSGLKLIGIVDNPILH